MADSPPQNTITIRSVKDPDEGFLVSAEFRGMDKRGEYYRVEFQWNLVMAQCIADNINEVLSQLKQ
jgi:hypothetical protein